VLYGSFAEMQGSFADMSGAKQIERQREICLTHVLHICSREIQDRFLALLREICKRDVCVSRDWQDRSLSLSICRTHVFYKLARQTKRERDLSYTCVLEICKTDLCVSRHLQDRSERERETCGTHVLERRAR